MAHETMHQLGRSIDQLVTDELPIRRAEVTCAVVTIRLRQVITAELRALGEIDELEAWLDASERLSQLERATTILEGITW